MALQTETYRGFKVYFRPLSIRQFKVAAQVPKITSQFLGAGKTKKEAFDDAKKEIDKHIRRKS